MKKRKAALIREAERKYGRIYPCSNLKSLNDCFTTDYHPGRLYLWFNIEGGSTRVVSES